MTGNFNDENNNPRKLLLSGRQVSRLLKAFVNNSSANIKLSKNRLPKIVQPAKFFGRRLRPLLIALKKNVLKTLVKRVLIPLRLTAAESSANARIHKKLSDQG